MPTITLTRKEYGELEKKARVYDAFWGKEVKIRNIVPTVYLSGKSAKKLDQRVERSMREYRAGKTRRIKSIADLM